MSAIQNLPHVSTPAIVQSSPSRAALEIGPWRDDVFFDFAWMDKYNSLVEVMNALGVNGVRLGREKQMIRCPFHDDSTPSLSIYKNRWMCHAGCTKRQGGVIDFVQRFCKLSNPHAAARKLKAMGFKVKLLSPPSGETRLARLPISDHQRWIIRRTVFQQIRATREFKRFPAATKYVARELFDLQTTQGAGFEISFGELAELTGFCPRTVIAAVNRLEAARFLSVKRRRISERRNAVNRYTLLPPASEEFQVQVLEEVFHEKSTSSQLPVDLKSSCDPDGVISMQSSQQENPKIPDSQCERDRNLAACFGSEQRKPPESVSLDDFFWDPQHVSLFD